MSKEQRRFEELGIDQEKFDSFQVICLPENIFKSNEELQDAGDARHFAKLLQASNIRCGTSFDLGFDIPLLQRRSRDKWFGVVWIRDHLTIPLIVGTLANYLASEIHDKTSGSVQPKVHIDLYMERGENVTNISYSGDAKTLIQILDNVNPPEPSR